jgi:ribokinase
MKILNFGSLNIDHVYNVAHFVRPGETLNTAAYSQFAGGKGSNQSVALARAGAPVAHAGKIGRDGLWLKERLDKLGVDTGGLKVIHGPTGHAIIQVNAEGENAILLHGGANRDINAHDIDETLARFGEGDMLLVQNEISNLPLLISKAADRGLRVVFNPAPMEDAVLAYPLDRVGMFILNEIEGESFTGAAEPAAMLEALRARFPEAAIVLTLGSRGVLYADAAQRLEVPAVRVDAVDTTAAGDTFIGYFLAGLAGNDAVEQALRAAVRAAAICVTRPGAADSIPSREEIETTPG